MTLSDFIETNLEELIDDWVEFARKLSSSDYRLTDDQLRNSARALLTGISTDMRSTQSTAQQLAKSLGQRRGANLGFNTVAHRHADDRLEHGFEINAIVAEYRALRACVLRRWQLAPSSGAEAFQEMIRFNEAIDQTLAESIRQYAQRTELIRDMFAGVLAHDMRSPIVAIMNAADLLLGDENLSFTSVKASLNVQRSAGRLKRMIDDLFTFTRTRLGNTLTVEPTPQDLGRICDGAVEEVRAACPDAQIELQLKGELVGVWDGNRIAQLLVNLITNAVRYGSGKIVVEAMGDGQQASLVVSNEGTPIPPNALPTIFDPLTRASPEHRKAASGIGLGLHICRCIAHAHQGTIAVESTDEGTIFTVKIPRSLATPAASQDSHADEPSIFRETT